MLTIMRGAVAVLSMEPDDLSARLDTLCSAPGFIGAVVHRALDDPGKTLTYMRWSDANAAMTALGGADGPDAASFVLIEATDVRLATAPNDHEGAMTLKDDGTVALIVPMELEPTRSAELLDELNTATDSLLPAFDAVLGVTFHRSLDGIHVIEYLQAESAEGMKAVQEQPDIKEHESRVQQIARSLHPDLYRVERIVGAS